MKKRLYIMTTILTATAALFLSSCLKDKSHYVNFNTGQTLVDFPLGGFVNFSTDAITESAPDSVNGQPNTKEAITRQFAVNVASANLTTAPTNVTLAVGGASDVTKINQLQSNVSFVMMPSNAYKFTTTKVTIPSGKLYVITSVTFYKALLDPAISYVLPIYIVSADNNAKLTSNLNIHYFHFIGNDFAGVYAHHYYTRHSIPDTTGSYATSDAGGPVDVGSATFFPVTGTQFQVQSYYYTGLPYTVSFTKTGLGSSATYSNWTIGFNAADISYYWGTTITLGAGPYFDVNPSYFNPAFDPAASYTYEQSLKIFRFYYTTATRAVQDEYVK